MIWIKPKLKKRERLRKTSSIVYRFGKRGRNLSVFLERKAAEALAGKEVIRAMRRTPEQREFSNGWFQVGDPQPNSNPYFLTRCVFENKDRKGGFSLDISLQPLEPAKPENGFFVDVSIKPSKDLLVDPARVEQARKVVDEYLPLLGLPSSIKVVKNPKLKIE